MCLAYFPQMCANMRVYVKFRNMCLPYFSKMCANMRIYVHISKYVPRIFSKFAHICAHFKNIRAHFAKYVPNICKNMRVYYIFAKYICCSMFSVVCCLFLVTRYKLQFSKNILCLGKHKIHIYKAGLVSNVKESGTRLHLKEEEIDGAYDALLQAIYGYLT